MDMISSDLPDWIIEEEKLVISNRHKRKTEEVVETVKIRVNRLSRAQTNRLRSPDFLLKRFNFSTWYLSIDPKDKEISSGIDYISIYLHLKEKNNNYQRFNGEIGKFRISLIDSEGNQACTKTSQYFYFSGLFGWGSKYFIKRTTLDRKSNTSNHSLYYQFNLLLRITLVQHANPKYQSQTKQLLHQDFDRNYAHFAFIHDLINDKEYCDVKFIFQDSHFMAHSTLLASKSPVFKSIFAKNKSFHEVLITEFDAEVFYELITFVYKGFAPNIEKHCEKLLIAADYYEIPQLKSMCDYLCFRRLVPEVAIDALLFAIRYKAFSVKVRAICYIATNLNQVVDSSLHKWKKFKKLHQNLVQQILAIRQMKCQCCEHVV